MEDKMQELQILETERGDIITKLKKIDERKSTVSHEVYEKVKSEYEDKLKEIDSRMTEYADLMKEEVARVDQEESTCVEEERTVKLKVEELELRYSIGEYDEDAYNTTNEEYKAQINDINGRLEKLHDRRKWLEEFTAQKGAEQEVEEKAPESEMKIEEHILEKTLPEEELKLDELLVEEEAVRPEAPAEIAPEEKKKEETAQEQQPETPPEQEKSVPCPKCGTLNAPDSWYCEKCGAEILDTPAP
jgi:hypothetical protein